MTKYPFKLNGKDFSRLVHKFGYQTERRPVFASRYEDLDGRTRSIVGHWSGVLSIQLNDIPAADAAALGAELLTAPLEVTYYSFQLKREVTERMMVENFPLALKLATAATDWLAGVTLKFEEE